MSKSVFDKITALKNQVLPCESISTSIFSTDKLDYMDNNSLALTINYPKKLKIITQSQAVDFQALVGYIGGYIGLFLGNLDNKIHYVYFIVRKHGISSVIYFHTCFHFYF